MAGALRGIIDQLERQKTAIDRALTALRLIEGIAAPATATEVKSPATAEAPTLKRRKFSAASRKKNGLGAKSTMGQNQGRN